MKSKSVHVLPMLGFACGCALLTTCTVDVPEVTPAPVLDGGTDAGAGGTSSAGSGGTSSAGSGGTSSAGSGGTSSAGSGGTSSAGSGGTSSAGSGGTSSAGSGGSGNAGGGAAGSLPTETYLSFDGVDDFVETPENSVFNLSGGSFSLCAWIRPLDWGDNSQGRIVDHGGGTAEGWAFHMENKPGEEQTLRVQINHSAMPFEATADVNSIQLGTWQHVAVTFVGGSGTLRFWVNGTAAGSFTGLPVPSPRALPVRMGRRASDDLRTYVGDMDEVLIWNRELSGSEIRAVMDGETTGQEPGLVAFYRFDEGSGQQVVDSGPLGLHGTLGPSSVAEPTDPTRMP